MKTIVIALDVSGSMSSGSIESSLSKVKTIFGRAKYKYVTFDSVSIFVKNFKKLSGGGGTDFQSIENLIQRKYPSVVVVITDGYGSIQEVKHPERWYWILTSGIMAVPKLPGTKMFE